MTTKKERHQLANILDQDSVAEFVLRSIINFYDLASAARTLIYEKEIYGAGQSLAIASLEELGKVALGIQRLANEISSSDMVDRIFSHKRKQKFGQAVAALAPNILNVADELNKGSVRKINFEEFINRISSDPETVLKHFSGPDVIDALQSIVEVDLEEQRQRGLYVTLASDIDKTDVLYPRQISKAQAETTLAIVVLFEENLTSSNDYEMGQLSDGINLDEIPEDQAIDIVKGYFIRLSEKLKKI